MRTEEQRRKAREAMQRWRAKNPSRPRTEEERVKERARVRKWRQANPERVRSKQRRFGKVYWRNNPWSRCLGPRRAHAKKKGIIFELKVADVRAIWTGKCVLTGLPFDLRPSVTTSRKLPPGGRPFSPSLDRIKPCLGYVPGNIRFVLHCVNSFKGVMRDTLMKRVAARMLDYKPR